MVLLHDALVNRTSVGSKFGTATNLGKIQRREIVRGEELVPKSLANAMRSRILLSYSIRRISLENLGKFLAFFNKFKVGQ